MSPAGSRSGRALLLYDAAAADGDAAERDVFDQLDAIEPVLGKMGLATERYGVGLDLGALKKAIDAARPDVAVNLVESVGGSDRLQTLIPLALEDWGIAFTGCGAAAMLVSNDKIGSKRALATHGLSVPGCLWSEPGGGVNELGLPGAGWRGEWIVKAAEAHASLHLDDSSVLVNASLKEAAERAAAESGRHGMRFFAEQYIEGREFNISLLEEMDGGVRVLPAAEIRFDTLPEGRARIVGYAAKWAEESEEYAGTVRSFEFGEDDAGLVERVCGVARRAWDALGLGGYARVDFRIDRQGMPYILEINANPCLTPGAGFAAAAERAGLSYDELIETIVRVALRGT